MNPNLVLVRESCYGLQGPWAHRKGWEQLAQTCCGAAVLASQGHAEKHIVAALPSDYGAGYLGAAGAVSALRQRQSDGGFWTVDVNLCGTIMLPLSLPHEAEDAVAVTAGELGDYMIDQQWGDTTFTRLKSAAVLSHTPAFCAIGPSILGSRDAHRTTWDPVEDAAEPAREIPSAYAREGRLVGVLEGYGHEDILVQEAAGLH